jgi:hypothetical protein
MDSDDDTNHTMPAQPPSLMWRTSKDMCGPPAKRQRIRLPATPLMNTPQPWPKTYLAATTIDDIIVIAGALVVSSAEHTTDELSRQEQQQMMRLPKTLHRTIIFPKDA